MGILFTLLLTIFAFLIGMVIGSHNVSTADGLAGGAIVLSYGLIGAVLALIVGIALSLKLDPKICPSLHLSLYSVFWVPLGTSRGRNTNGILKRRGRRSLRQRTGPKFPLQHHV